LRRRSARPRDDLSRQLLTEASVAFHFAGIAIACRCH
jgi:hypothetical protein